MIPQKTLNRIKQLVVIPIVLNTLPQTQNACEISLRHFCIISITIQALLIFVLKFPRTCRIYHIISAVQKIATNNKNKGQDKCQKIVKYFNLQQDAFYAAMRHHLSLMQIWRMATTSTQIIKLSLKCGKASTVYIIYPTKYQYQDNYTIISNSK